MRVRFWGLRGQGEREVKNAPFEGDPARGLKNLFEASLFLFHVFHSFFSFSKISVFF